MNYKVKIESIMMSILIKDMERELESNFSTNYRKAFEADTVAKAKGLSYSNWLLETISTMKEQLEASQEI